MEAVREADVLTIMTPWPEFRNITSDILGKNMKGKVVIDPYRIFDGTKLRAMGFTYAALGTPVKQ
jgi:UDPglucose 6-dehydrogenase